MILKGVAKKNIRTKALITRLTPNDIAVIDHRDIDGVAAIQLADKKIKAVINADRSISGKYPNRGPKILSNAGIPIIDNVGQNVFDKIMDNDTLEISNRGLFVNGNFLCTIACLNKEDIEIKMDKAASNLWTVLDSFIENTLEYAKREKELIINPIELPNSSIDMNGRHVLVVIRGESYREDLRAVQVYIDEVNPIMIGVDGGANALLDFGYRPDIIIGDMDSVSDASLKSCKEIIVHAYRNGYSPGMRRIEDLGLKAIKFPFTGTSEDAALVLAYEQDAELIVTVGSHTNMIDFLEKGRPGMASTMLIQMKVGHKVVDAKGVSELYKNRIRPGYIAAVFAATLFPLSVVAKTSPLIKEIYRLISLRLRILFGL
ncbi:MAG TPA: putative cytokinetic ring protein SteA [Clostridia bacterium]|nr:putative cytokinetic ring protein SteA [Clostridia bacterium]